MASGSNGSGRAARLKAYRAGKGKSSKAKTRGEKIASKKKLQKENNKRRESLGLPF